jgi:hypothetical protein
MYEIDEVVGGYLQNNGVENYLNENKCINIF